MSEDEKKFSQAEVETMIQDRLKRSKGEIDELKQKIDGLTNKAAKFDEIENAGKTEAEKWKKKWEAEKKRGDGLETKITNHQQLRSLRSDAKKLIESKQLREGAYEMVETMIRPDDDLDKIEKEYIPRLAKYFPPSSIGSSGREPSVKLPDNENRVMNETIFKAAGG